MRGYAILCRLFPRVFQSVSRAMISRTLTLISIALPRLATRLLHPVFAGLLLMTAVPLFSVDVPPLADYINHLARMNIIANISHDPVLARLYQIDWAIIPNLVMDLVVPRLVDTFGIYMSGQLFILATVLLLVSGPMVIHRALYGRVSAWPLVAFPFIYNGIFLFGFLYYLFGVGLAMWGIGAWISLRERPAWQRGVVSLGFVLMTFFAHLFALGVYGLGLMAFEGWRLANGRCRLLRDGAALALPVLPVVPLMLASPTLGLSKENIWETEGKLDGLHYIVRTYSDLTDLSLAAIAVAGVVWAHRRGLLRLHAAGWALLTLGGIVFMVMPRMLFGSWMADQRLPIALLFVVIGFARLNLSHQLVRRSFYALVMGLTLLRCVTVDMHWHELDEVTSEMRRSAKLIVPGSAVLVAHADRPVGSTAVTDALSHAPCIAVIERSALVATAFTVPGKQVLSVRPPYRGLVDSSDGDPPTVSQLLASPIPGHEAYWDGWGERYQYLYVLFTEQEAENPNPDALTLVYEGPLFQLYRIIPQEP